jgi:very-long-chain enoyl-CoA reductase
LGDFNRVGLFDPATKKIFKDRKAVLKDQASVSTQGELLVKDLG